MPSGGLEKRSAAVVGGGISGLYAAKKLADAGYAVDVYEASPKRLGGKIESATLPGSQTPVNNGAEFIDSTHARMQDICKETGVKLVSATDQSTESYQLQNGSVMNSDQFFAAVAPVKQRIAKDKMDIASAPTGERAYYLDHISVTQYLAELSGMPQDQPSDSLWMRVKNLTQRTWTQTKMTFGSKDVVDPGALKTLGAAYGSEAGRDPENVSALQFVNESSAQKDKLLASDCAYRVEGGTEAVVTALRKELEGKGVRFHMDAKATALAKGEDGKFNLAFEIPQVGQTLHDKVIMALPMNAVAKIKGMEALGMTQEAANLLQNGQYTQSAKLTVRTKVPVEDSCMFSADGLQAWRSSPDTVTFLLGGETLNQRKGKDLVDYSLERYAAAHNTTADKIFDTSQVVFRAPDKEKSCYASPAPGQTLQFQKLGETADAMAQNGVGIVGSFLPNRSSDNAIGFMESGVRSADRAVGIMLARDREVAEVQARAAEEALSQPTVNYAATELARRQQKAQGVKQAL
jgi:monoamine oxidase